MISKEEALIKVTELVRHFEEQIDSYKKSDYNETLTRRDFIYPFFKALGWDMDNEQGLPECYRDVFHENRIKAGQGTKAPEYSFRLNGGKRLFFVEIQKPGPCYNIRFIAQNANKPPFSVPLRLCGEAFTQSHDILPAYQVRRYGWSAKLSISIVTDFEEFAVYDCTKKPNSTDKAAVARIKYITFREYISDFDFLWNTFSKEKAIQGSFDTFIKSDTNKKGTTTVDKEFLNSLDTWRMSLGTNISKTNLTLGEDEINFAVQQFIDRIIFLRIAEDRAVEAYGTLLSIVSDVNHVRTGLRPVPTRDTVRTVNKRLPTDNEYYANLVKLYRKANQKYNSGIFDFKKDRISTSLKVDNKIVKTILTELYYPDCPYEFSVISIEILGSAYEQFLGKQIKINPPTPTFSKRRNRGIWIEEKPEVRKAGGVYYTPEYIVEYIVKQTVGQLIENKTPKEVQKIKVVDPACGSGSFLIGAYQYLLDWHKNYYNRNKKSWTQKDSPITPDGNLTTGEKKRILINNIHGVDIDVNAIEVTKLSLLLKCMEGETDASISHQLRLLNERVLPTLDDNIKSGNSLIDTDFYNDEIFKQEEKTKPFHWQTAFPQVFNQGGFDAVIGNPPYGADLSIKVSLYLRGQYQVANYQLDTYNLFFERGNNILRPSGYLGYIVPSAWVASKYDIKLRSFLIEKTKIENFVITPKHTFKDANVETCIVILTNSVQTNKFKIERWDTIDKKSYWLSTKEIKQENNYVFPVYSNNSVNKVVKKIKKQKSVVNDFADVSWGVKVYQKGKGKPSQKGNESVLKVFHSTKKTKKSHRPLLGGSEIARYSLQWKGRYIDYGVWLAEPRQAHWFNGEIILVREVTANGIIQATFVERDYVFSNSVDGIKLKTKEFSPKYLLGIINSKIVSFYHSNTSANAFKGAFPKLLLQDLRDIPIPTIDFKNKIDLQLHDEIVKNVDLLLQLNEELPTIKLHTKIEEVKARIERVEANVNQSVYKLYDLTNEEIRIVEGVVA